MRPQKTCKVCGRRFCWRRKWARNWDEVRYCSDACRRRGLRSTDRQIENRILVLLAERPSGLSSCELERLLQPGAGGRAGLRGALLMAARRLRHTGTIEILQSGRTVDPDTARGPVCLRALRRC